jgi:hypothetical protein
MSALKLLPFSKVCNNCKTDKQLHEFSKNSKSKDGYQYRCKECDNKYQSERRKSNHKEHLEYDRNYQANKRKDFEYRLRMLVNASKQRAKLKNRDHSITVEDIKAIYPIDGCCPIFGMKLEFNNAGFRENSPSIDRIDSSKGYTLDNIQIISWKANRIKSYATVEELEVIVAYMKQGN